MFVSNTPLKQTVHSATNFLIMGWDLLFGASIQQYICLSKYNGSHIFSLEQWSVNLVLQAQPLETSNKQELRRRQIKMKNKWHSAACCDFWALDTLLSSPNLVYVLWVAGNEFLSRPTPPCPLTWWLIYSTDWLVWLKETSCTGSRFQLVSQLVSQSLISGNQLIIIHVNYHVNAN